MSGKRSREDTTVTIEPIKDLGSATPREVDEKLTEWYIAEMRARSVLADAIVSTHYALNEKKIYISRNRFYWPTTDAEALAAVKEKAKTFVDNGGYAAYKPTEVLAKLEKAEAEKARILAAQEVLEAEYRRRPWSRFFLVTSSNGHIHKNMRCSTCFETTEYAWLPHLAGKTEAEAVADQGTRLCSVCFPTAPVEWTVGITKPDNSCAGGHYVNGTSATFGMRTYGECPTCHTRQIVNQGGTVRKHPKPKDES